MKRFTALIICIMILLTGCASKIQSKELAVAEYPEQAEFPHPNTPWPSHDEMMVAWHAQNDYKDALVTDSTGHKDFVKKLVQETLTDNGQNLAFSPADIYFSLAVLAESTNGSSRQQILDLLSRPDVEALRSDAKNLWNKMYLNDNRKRLVLANSLWLSDKSDYNAEKLNVIKDEYYSSAFSGDFGAKNYFAKACDWLEQQSEGNIDAKSGVMKFDKQSALALYSTTAYKAHWNYMFFEDKTVTDVFHSPNGDAQASFLCRPVSYVDVYYSETFEATPIYLGDKRESMDVIIPKDNFSIEDVLKDEKAIQYIIGNLDDVSNEKRDMYIYLPKFEMSSSIDLSESFSKLGVTDLLDPQTADFSGVLNTDSGEYLSLANHLVEFGIDEVGVESTEFMTLTIERDDGAIVGNAEFKANKPFIFVVRGNGHLPLFVGIVNNP